MSKNSKVTTRTLHYYWQEIKKYKWLSLGFFILSPLVIFVRNVLSVFVFADIIDKVSSGLTKEQIFTIVLPEVLIYLAIAVVNSLLFEKLRLYCCWKMELLSMRDLDNMAFNTICAQSMQFHNDRFSGSLVSQTNKFTGSFERFMDVVIWDLLPILTYVICVTVILWQRTPLFTLIILAVVAIYTLFSALSFKKIADYSEDEAAATAKKTGQLADSVSNITSVKSYAKEKYEQHRYNRFQNGWLGVSYKLMHATIKRDLLFSISIMGLTAAMLFFLMTGTIWFGLSISTLVLIVTYSETLLGDLYDITHIFKNINRSLGDAREMTRILDMADEVVDANNAKKLEVTKSEIVFDNITFRHHEAKEKIFKDFSLTIKPGERIGLVGVSGSGKTTLTRLLLRFADVDAGKILIDGQDIKTVTQNSLRENIAYVPQETALFHRSIAENIAYAKPEIDEKEIIRAAKLANVDGFIKDLPNGYETLVGERGIKLSGGQRQRIAIARAILKDAPILVLDEATSALDSESEALIQEALNNLMRNRTAIVIAHRLSTVANLDRIVVLKDGKIIEEGSHKELLKKKGDYYKLWSRQSGAFIEES
ncbi:MAG: ABC transporter ATP-binding protein/permease [Candidatus Saccharibacteria bacterium]|nr:ABC transporter ATP-binding protein/permease [Candidatus Saccharibacteria bacterium]